MGLPPLSNRNNNCDSVKERTLLFPAFVGEHWLSNGGGGGKETGQFAISQEIFFNTDS